MGCYDYKIKTRRTATGQAIIEKTNDNKERCPSPGISGSSESGVMWGEVGTIAMSGEP